MYYKPYSLWKPECQAVYSTYEVAGQAELIGDVADL